MSKQSGFGLVGIFIAVLVIVSVGSAGWFVLNQNEENTAVLDPKPDSNSLSSFESQEVGYECSREIQGNWTIIKGQLGQDKWTFIPDDPKEVEKYCRSTYAIEYHAVLDILKRQDVIEVIDKYDSSLAWVKVLNYEYIQDKDYIDKILPDYSDVDIHCVVVVHSPEGDRFFLEKGEHDYIEVPSDEFLSSLNSASDEDVNTFWLNLR